MTTALKNIDSVRASRDGHEFHETWAARLALRLLIPTDEFVGIAMEGPAAEDLASASAATVQIADATLYYGRRPVFKYASSVNIVQVKYSVGKASKPFRVTDAKKTIEKFAASYLHHKATNGAKQVRDKLTFELVTNQKIAGAFDEAVRALASGKPARGDAKKQAEQFTTASGLKGGELAAFSQKLKLTGMAGGLGQNNLRLSRVIVNWSATNDAIARARLGEIKSLLREKAGMKGEGRNTVTRVDVLERLGLSGPEDLFPCASAFPEIGPVVPRAQLGTTIGLVPGLKKPLLIHAAGGVGKTVFLQSLAMALSKDHEVVLFDCFGGGGYRAPEDARHLPKRGLLHIVNSLACKGFCDPLLPPNNITEELLRAFRNRLTQAVEMLAKAKPGALLLLFIDAIDNAADEAKDKGHSSFPKLILESFQHKGPIPGVKLIVSCRTHRRELSKNGIPCEEVELLPFDKTETGNYLKSRITGLTNSEIHVAFSRSGGNPRILEHLALSDRGLLDPSEVRKTIKLDKLLRDRIEKALGEAERRGYKKAVIDSFLAGLAVLPPPVPVVEYANANDIDIAAVESFAADLAPLLEKTKHGLMFRDEPTETFVKENYAAKKPTLKKLSANLFKRQGESVYAASALPGLLTRLDDGGTLFKLAFDDRFPQAISTKVGQQRIRHSRLTAAVLQSSRKGETGNQTLSRPDGLWLADGLDRPPIEIQVNLMETDSSGPKLTSSKSKILALLGINKRIFDGLVVFGNWNSADNIDVRINSALVPRSVSTRLAKQLAKKDPFQVYLPSFDDDSDPRARTVKGQKTVKWIVSPSTIPRLDETDPWGSSSAIGRPKFAKRIETHFSLKPVDSFERGWVNAQNLRVATAHAWGSHEVNEHAETANGIRLQCTAAFVKEILAATGFDLLLLVVLRRYEKGFQSERSKYWHTTALVKVGPSLNCQFFAGASNKFHDSKF